jgi:hypothetical protein
MKTTSLTSYLIRKNIAVPQDHGSWVFLLSPLLIGLFASKSFSVASAWLILVTFAAFMIRQPLTITAKIYSGRRAIGDLKAAWFWIAVYGLMAILAFVKLVLLGFAYLSILAIPAIFVLVINLILIKKHSERHKIGLLIAGAGALALTAPASLWVGQGSYDPSGWGLFLLTWLQAAASIIYAYLRLDQRTLQSLPNTTTKLRMGRWTLLFTGINLFAILLLVLFNLLPKLIWLPYAVQFGEAIRGTLKPAIGIKVVLIGAQLTVVSAIFTALFIGTWGL